MFLRPMGKLKAWNDLMDDTLLAGVMDSKI